MTTILARNPVEGGSTVIRLSFRDEAGRFYEPLRVFYTLYAQNKDKDTWEVVGKYHKVQVLPRLASVCDILFQGDALALLPDCTTKRRVIIDFSYMRGSEVTNGRDMVDFEVVPLPVLSTTPPEPIPPVSLPLVIKEIFQANNPTGVMVGILFSDPVDVSSIQDGTKTFYLGDQNGDVVSGLILNWNSDRTIAWGSFSISGFPTGDYILFIHSSLKSLDGSFLNSDVPANGDGFHTFPVHLFIPEYVDLTQILGDIEDLKARVKNLDDALDETATNESLIDLEKEVSDLSSKIDDLEVMLSDVEDDITNLKQAVADLQP